MFDIPPPPKLWLPPKPAIVRAASLKDAPVLLAMPIIGTFAAASARAFRAKGGGTLSTIFGPTTLGSTSGSWGTYTFVTYFTNANLLAGGSGCTLSDVILKAQSGGTLVVGNVYVGHRAASGDLFDFDSTPTQFLNGGSAGATISAGATGTWTGSYVLPSGKDPMIAIESTSATLAKGSPLTGFNQYFKTGSDAATVNKSTYTERGSFEILIVSELKALV